MTKFDSVISTVIDNRTFPDEFKVFHTLTAKNHDETTLQINSGCDDQYRAEITYFSLLPYRTKRCEKVADPRRQ
jgi:hypothetical protein